MCRELCRAGIRRTAALAGFYVLMIIGFIKEISILIEFQDTPGRTLKPGIIRREIVF